MATTGTRKVGSVKMPAPLTKWWVFLISGAAWILIAWVVLRFNIKSVTAVAVLAGVVILVAAVSEFFTASQVRDWRWLHITLGVLFVITSIVTFIHPGNTFIWLAAFLGWYLLFKGIADIVLAFATKADNEAWWLLLIIGIFEVIAGFWSAGRFTRSAYLLVVIVGVIALTRGITDIVTAFRVRKDRGVLEEAETDLSTVMGTGPGTPRPA
jgi:uncharacterized membrane protein HdeD (DUF308 family)